MSATTPLTRRPAWWAVYALVALAALAVAIKLFPLAIPVVNLDVTLTRDAAVAKAVEVAAKAGLGPQDPRTAVRFSNDSGTQNYVELEGGGKPAFAALVNGALYAPYWWDVRLFRPGEVQETIVRFKPDGSSNGFTRRVADAYVHDAARKALPPTEARTLAETRAKADWSIDLAPYRLIEQSEQTKPNGRVDHAFVYERPEKLGEATIRLRLGVAGDELVEVAPYVRIPESFDRRFQELRSANNLIAGLASGAAGLLYGVGGLVVGGLWLLRHRWLAWRPALVAGAIVGALLAAASLANTPSDWFGYDTAQSESVFWVRQVGRSLAVLLAGAVGYTLVFMVAESLSRRAFPHQPQLWKLWSRDAGASPQVLGRTLGGMLFVPIELALVAAFYYLSNRWLGWWQPSESLTDPNILGSAAPALTPIAISLQAGFMEECAFRAIPLALGALVGARLGARNAGIAVAFVLQALVFGGAHANYPGLPAYSRLVELIVPSMIWALIFLRFGLLPTIVLHALFDLTLFSIPLFLVDAPGAGFWRALVVVAGAVPLLVVAARRLAAGRFIELPDALRNGAWRPPEPRQEEAVVHAHPLESAGYVRRFQQALPLLAIVGLALWAVAALVPPDVPPLPLSRSAAIAKAEEALAQRGVRLPPEWRRSATIRLASEDSAQWTMHRFVWREAGPERYRALVGHTLAPPLWIVRFARFEGDVVARAEEWRVTVDGRGDVRQVVHEVPEQQPGARPTREQALAIAEREIATRFGVDPSRLRLISVQDRARDARTDWAFLWTDPSVEVGDGGEARIGVTLAGDEVASSGRSVFVPETWLRAERDRSAREQAIRLAAGLAGALAAIAALIVGIVDWSRRRTDPRASRLVAGLVLVLALATAANSAPQIAFRLDTAEPIASQLAVALLGLAVAGLLTALVAGLVAGVGAWHARTMPPHALAGRLPPWLAGVAAALFAAGAATALAALTPSRVPDWPSYAAEARALPAVAAAIDGLRLVAVAAGTLFVLHLFARMTAGWSRRHWIALLPAIAFALAGLAAQRDVGLAVAAGAGAGLLIAAVLYGVLRFDARTVPAFIATGMVLSQAADAIGKRTGEALVLLVVEAVVTIVAAWAVTRYLATPWPRASTPVAREPVAPDASGPASGP